MKFNCQWRWCFVHWVKSAVPRCVRLYKVGLLGCLAYLIILFYESVICYIAKLEKLLLECSARMEALAISLSTTHSQSAHDALSAESVEQHVSSWPFAGRKLRGSDSKDFVFINPSGISHGSIEPRKDSVWFCKILLPFNGLRSSWKRFLAGLGKSTSVPDSQEWRNTQDPSVF